MVWIKNRNANSDPIIQDTVRGITKLLETDGTAAESNNSVFGHVDSVESNGFTVDSGGVQKRTPTSQEEITLLGVGKQGVQRYQTQMGVLLLL